MHRSKINTLYSQQLRGSIICTCDFQLSSPFHCQWNLSKEFLLERLISKQAMVACVLIKLFVWAGDRGAGPGSRAGKQPSGSTLHNPQALSCGPWHCRNAVGRTMAFLALHVQRASIRHSMSPPWCDCRHSILPTAKGGHRSINFPMISARIWTPELPPLFHIGYDHRVICSESPNESKRDEIEFISNVFLNAFLRGQTWLTVVMALRRLWFTRLPITESWDMCGLPGLPATSWSPGTRVLLSPGSLFIYERDKQFTNFSSVVIK
jgi:hypothetical protein